MCQPHTHTHTHAGRRFISSLTTPHQYCNPQLTETCISRQKMFFLPLRKSLPLKLFIPWQHNPLSPSKLTQDKTKQNTTHWPRRKLCVHMCGYTQKLYLCCLSLSRQKHTRAVSPKRKVPCFCLSFLVSLFPCLCVSLSHTQRHKALPAAPLRGDSVLRGLVKRVSP